MKGKTYQYHYGGIVEVKRYFTLTMGWRVDDCTKTKRYQKEDIDFIVHKPDGSEQSIALKVDGEAHQTGNVYVEVLMERKKNSAGWLNYCKADVVYYYLREIGQAVLLDRLELQKLCATEEADKWKRRHLNRTDMCNAQAYVFSIRALQETPAYIGTVNIDARARRTAAADRKPEVIPFAEKVQETEPAEFEQVSLLG